VHLFLRLHLLQVLSRDPWLLSFGAFLSSAEAAALETFCDSESDEGWGRSEDVGDLQPDGSFASVGARPPALTPHHVTDGSFASLGTHGSLGARSAQHTVSKNLHNALEPFLETQ